jgi:hypothetical protein
MSAGLSRSCGRTPEGCLPISKLLANVTKVVQVEFVPYRVQMLTRHETFLVFDRLAINGWLISSSAMIYRTQRIHRGLEGVMIVTADMSISFALHFCLSLSPLIAMFSMMGPGNTSTLSGKPRFLASSTALRGIAE